MNNSQLPDRTHRSQVHLQTAGLDRIATFCERTLSLAVANPAPKGEPAHG